MLSGQQKVEMFGVLSSYSVLLGMDKLCELDSRESGERSALQFCKIVPGDRIFGAFQTIILLPTSFNNIHLINIKLRQCFSSLFCCLYVVLLLE